MISETIQAAKDGDVRAFAQIVRQYRQSVFRICVRILGDGDDAEDAVQETFRRKRRRRYEQEALRQRGGDCARDPESDAAGRDLETLFRKVTSALAPMQKTVFVLAEIEGLPFEEVRRITGWSAVQIKSNLYIARQKVRMALEKEL